MVDIGINLGRINDKNTILENAFNEGVHALIFTGTTKKGSFQARQDVIKYNSKYKDRVFSTVGIHPHNANNIHEDNMMEQLERYIKFDGVVAVGECGLDYDRMASSKEDQLKCFEAQVKLAIKYKKPLFIHQRNAKDDNGAFIDLISILDRYVDQLENVPVVIHCFTGNPSEVSEYVRRGWYIGITGWLCDERRNFSLCESLKLVPLDRIMVETDSPFLNPIKNERKKRIDNQPANLQYIIQGLAQVYGSTYENIKRTTIENTIKFFSLPEVVKEPIGTKDFIRVGNVDPNDDFFKIDIQIPGPVGTNYRDSLKGITRATISKKTNRNVKTGPKPRDNASSTWVERKKKPANKKSFDIKNMNDFPSLGST